MRPAPVPVRVIARVAYVAVVAVFVTAAAALWSAHQARQSTRAVADAARAAIAAQAVAAGDTSGTAVAAWVGAGGNLLGAGVDDTGLRAAARRDAIAQNIRFNRAVERQSDPAAGPAIAGMLALLIVGVAARRALRARVQFGQVTAEHDRGESPEPDHDGNRSPVPDAARAAAAGLGETGVLVDDPRGRPHDWAAEPDLGSVCSGTCPAVRPESPAPPCAHIELVGRLSALRAAAQTASERTADGELGGRWVRELADLAAQVRFAGLNAMLEAQRAGASGARFAAVAQHIKDLGSELERVADGSNRQLDVFEQQRNEVATLRELARCVVTVCEDAATELGS